MSSAIEVLESEMSGLIRLNEIDGLDTKSKEMNQRTIDALGKAIVALEKQENYVIDFIRLEVLHKSKKEQFRVFFKDGTEQVFQKKRVGEQK